jgi:hypothetical protein
MGRMARSSIVFAISCAALASACASAPKVAYTPAGMGGNAVFFVEERGDGDRRQFVVMCHPERTPPCARVVPGTIRNEASLTAWVESQAAFERRVRPRPRVRAIMGPRVRTPVPLVDEEGASATAQAEEVVDARTPPQEAPPPEVRPGTGIVNIVTPGGWANVYDGEGHFLGQTPIQLRLAEGEHTLTLRPFGQPPGDPDPLRVRVTTAQAVSIVKRLDAN